MRFVSDYTEGGKNDTTGLETRKWITSKFQPSNNWDFSTFVCTRRQKKGVDTNQKVTVAFNWKKQPLQRDVTLTAATATLEPFAGLSRVFNGPPKQSTRETNPK